MIRAVVATVLLGALQAVADDAPVLAPSLVPSQSQPGEALREAMHVWHRGERTSGFVPFLISGVSTVTTGSLLVAGGSQLGRGAGWTLLSFGALEVLAGLYFGLSSFGKEAALDAAFLADPVAFQASERARLNRITSRFQPILLAVEGALTLAGGTTAAVGGFRKDDTMLGVGLGLAVQGLVLFLLDWAVLDRAQAYASVLR
jgi:hypothetical protein